MKVNNLLRSRFLILSLVYLLTLSSCSSTRKWRKGLEEEWIGMTKDELVQKRGAPNEINNTEITGTEICIYLHNDFSPDIPPNTYSEDFFVNDKGVIYKIETYRW